MKRVLSIYGFSFMP